MQTIIAVTLKDVYGQTKAYPANDQASRLAALVGTKTLTVETLRQAQAMGFALTYVDRFGSCNELADRALAVLAS
jgi:hypothetical protein